MRTFELRVCKLRTKEALDFYMEKIYPRHLNSFPLFGIVAHGSSRWSPMQRAKNPARSLGGICKAQNFADDIRNFNVSDIVCVESTILIPSTNSPLK